MRAVLQLKIIARAQPRSLACALLVLFPALTNDLELQFFLVLLLNLLLLRLCYKKKTNFYNKQKEELFL